MADCQRVAQRARIESVDMQWVQSNEIAAAVLMQCQGKFEVCLTTWLEVSSTIV